MVIRTYFDKNNTIIDNQYTNTGLNPITEIVYGGKDTATTNNIYSRFLFHFDLTSLISQYNAGNLGNLSFDSALSLCRPSKVTTPFATLQ